MNVASTYQLNKVVIVLNFKKLMFKAMCNSHQHLYSRKTKGHIQGLLWSNKGRRYENILFNIRSTISCSYLYSRYRTLSLSLSLSLSHTHTHTQVNSLSPQWIQTRENVDKVTQRYKVSGTRTKPSLKSKIHLALTLTH